MMKKVLCIIFALCFTAGGLPVCAAVDNPTYAVDQTFEEGNIGYYGKITNTDSANYGNDVIYFSQNHKDNNNFTSVDSYLGMEAADAAKQISLVKNSSVTGRDSTVLQITHVKEQNTNANARVSLGPTGRDYRSAANHLNDHILLEFSVRFPDLDLIPEDGSDFSKHSFLVAVAFSGGGTRDQIEIRKSEVRFTSAQALTRYSTIGVEKLSTDKWYTFTKVIDMNNCTQSLYLDGVLLSTQYITTAAIVAANTWNTAALKSVTFNFTNSSAYTINSDFRAFVDNVKLYGITAEEAAQMEVDSIASRVKQNKDIYLPAVASRIYAGGRVGGNMTSDSTTTDFTPDISFVSSDERVVISDGKLAGSSLEYGNEPDLSANISVTSDRYRHVSDGAGGYTKTLYKSASETIPLFVKRPLADSYLSDVEIGVPLIINDDDKFRVESFIAEKSGNEREMCFIVGFYDYYENFIKAKAVKQNIDGDGEKIIISEAKPDAAYTARIFFWDSNGFKPAAKFEAVSLTDGTEPVTLKLPADFAALNFDITKYSAGKYTHNATPENQLGGEPLNIYISDNNTTSGLGLSQSDKISYSRFSSNCTSGLYDSYFPSGKRKFILNVLDEYYTAQSYIKPAELGADVLIKSASESGFTWFGKFARQENSSEISEKWSNAGDGIYKTKLAGTNIQVSFPVNFKSVDEYGMPKAYVRVSSLAQCIATQGSFYQQVTDGATADDLAAFAQDVYCNPFSGEDIKNVELAYYVPTSNYPARCEYDFGEQKLIFENIGFIAHSSKFQPHSSSDKAALMFFNCKFFRSKDNALYIMNLPAAGKTYKVYVFNSVAAYGTYDGFNYHAVNGSNCLAVEINSVSYGNGAYKLGYWNNGKGSQTVGTNTHSNNASTAHDGMKMLRVGGRYWDSEGPTAADGDTYTISIGCRSGSILSTSTGVKAGFYNYNTNNNYPKYVIDCYTYGANVTYGAYCPSGVDMYYLDCTAQSGITATGEHVKPLPGGWDSIISGQWAN